MPASWERFVFIETAGLLSVFPPPRYQPISCGSGIHFFSTTSGMETKPYRRHGTRGKARIPVRVTSVDQAHTFPENCHTLLVNPQGCGVRFSRPLKSGSRVRLDQLPGGGSATARVACSLPPDKGSKFWIIGIGLDAPGNLWYLAPAPKDWGEFAAGPSYFPVSANAIK